jgi:hypothetical protein
MNFPENSPFPQNRDDIDIPFPLFSYDEDLDPESFYEQQELQNSRDVAHLEKLFSLSATQNGKGDSSFDELYDSDKEEIIWEEFDDKDTLKNEIDYDEARAHLEQSIQSNHPGQVDMFKTLNDAINPKDGGFQELGRLRLKPIADIDIKYENNVQWAHVLDGAPILIRVHQPSPWEKRVVIHVSRGLFSSEELGTDKMVAAVNEPRESSNLIHHLYSTNNNPLREFRRRMAINRKTKKIRRDLKSLLADSRYDYLTLNSMNSIASLWGIKVLYAFLLISRNIFSQKKWSNMLDIGITWPVSSNLFTLAKKS